MAFREVASLIVPQALAEQIAASENAAWRTAHRASSSSQFAVTTVAEPLYVTTLTGVAVTP